jgi:hypothetical protein
MARTLLHLEDGDVIRKEVRELRAAFPGVRYAFPV